MNVFFWMHFFLDQDLEGVTDFKPEKVVLGLLFQF